MAKSRSGKSEWSGIHYDEVASAQFDPGIVEPAVDFLADLVGSEGRALEFGIGTGRIALPLAARCASVAGIDTSTEMVEQLHIKPGGADISVRIGDMATCTSQAPQSSDLVFSVWNTIANLATQDRQVACFRNAAQHLRPGGVFVVELWVPQPNPTFRKVFDMASQQSYAGRSRFIWPSECDLMARLAGMRLLHRFSDWHRSAFTASSGTHVSVWRRD